ncbi:MAG: modification enzyme, MiaB family, partial [Chloroflexi bacterium]|nr:modification enzyme, MiaB family [Chloroflexota bacterium]
SSIEPQHVDDDLLATMAGSGGRCMPHLHLPLQSGDDGVLRRMGRRYDAAFYARTVERVRTALPGAAIHADVIAGFPTEDDAAWARTVALVRSLDLAGLHVFRYSARPGTPATRMVGQVPEQVRRARAAELLALAEAMRRDRVLRAVGDERLVLFEAPDGAGGWIGHCEDMVTVRVGAGAGAASLEGEIARVAIDGPDPDDRARAIGHALALLPRPLFAGA